MPKSIGVIGAGAWGTALAQVFAAGGKDITLWAREIELYDALCAKQENTMYLPNVPLHEGIKFSNDLSGITNCLSYLPRNMSAPRWRP